jgi:hypothetical protein
MENETKAWLYDILKAIDEIEDLLQVAVNKTGNLAEIPKKTSFTSQAFHRIC